MILRAFRDFLSSDDELTDTVRQGGRERLRNLIASEVYHGRRPRGAGPVCLVLDRAAGIVHAGITGPLGVEAPVVDVHVYAKDMEDKGGSESVEDVYDALKDMLPGYAGTFGDQTVQLISQESEAIIGGTKTMARPFNSDSCAVCMASVCVTITWSLVILRPTSKGTS